MHHRLLKIKERLQPHAIPLAVLCIVTLAVYASSLQHDFLTNWDDDKYITSNEAIKGFTPAHIKAAFTRFYVGNYAPVQILSYMLDYEIWGMRASGFILTNILVHLANGLMYYRILVILAFSRMAAFMAAFIFLLHPVQVESVAWISQRKNLLAMSLFLMAFTWYIRYARLQPGEQGRGKAYALSLATFVGALLAKAVTVVLPVVLLVYDCCYSPGPQTKKRLPDKVLFILLALLVGIITFVAQQSDINDGQAGGRVPYHGGSPFYTFLTMLPVTLIYLKLLFFPVALNEAYPLNIKQGVDLEVICGGVAVAVMIAIGYGLFRHRRDLAFWYALIFICLAPVSQIIPLITLINDRYLYFPMLGVAALAGHVLGQLRLSRIFTGPRASRAGIPRFACILVILPLIILPWLSLKRALVWQNSVTLWNDTVNKSPSIDTCFAQADAYHGRHDLTTAKRLYISILEKDPTDRKTLHNLSLIYMEQNNFWAARPLLITLTRSYPTYVSGFIGLGSNYYMTGDLAQAEKYYRQALAIKPDLPEVLPLLGNVLLAKRELKQASFYLNKAAQIFTTSPNLFYSLACLRSLEKNIPEALDYLETALKLGYSNKKSILTNSELNNIRKAPAFTALVNKYFH